MRDIIGSIMIIRMHHYLRTAATWSDLNFGALTPYDVLLLPLIPMIANTTWLICLENSLLRNLRGHWRRPFPDPFCRCVQEFISFTKEHFSKRTEENGPLMEKATKRIPKRAFVDKYVLVIREQTTCKNVIYHLPLSIPRGMGVAVKFRSGSSGLQLWW